MPRARLIVLCAVLLAFLLSFSYLVSRTKAPSVSALPTATFGGVSLSIEVATTTEARKRGLGGREAIPENYGMLFVFDQDAYWGFWMKDMRVPIDIFWLDNKGQLVSMATDVSPDTFPDVFSPSRPSRYVLETAAGFARARGVATGTQFLLKNMPTVSK